MQGALWVSKTGLSAQDTKMTVIANNLANVSTTGFKKDRAVFNDLFYLIQRQPGAMADADNTRPTGLQLGTGVMTVGTQKIFTAGNTVSTGVDTDIAIEGKGFFQVELANGDTAYTRDGGFKVNAEGILVTSAGQALIPQIVLPEGYTGFSIAADGTVTATVGGDNQDLGQITLTDFTNPSGLEALGGNLYAETLGSGEPVEGVPGQEAFGELRQTYLETSNVNVAEEMVEMISTQRAYEMNAKALSGADEMLKTLNNRL